MHFFGPLKFLKNNFFLGWTELQAIEKSKFYELNYIEHSDVRINTIWSKSFSIYVKMAGKNNKFWEFGFISRGFWPILEPKIIELRNAS